MFKETMSRANILRLKLFIPHLKNKVCDWNHKIKIINNEYLESYIRLVYVLFILLLQQDFQGFDHIYVREKFPFCGF